jgi:serine/threonine-protein kinase
VRRRRIGRYELIERLGGGFAGDVWLVADAETSRRFVMKTPAGVVRGKPSEKVGALLRALVAEADALKRLYHPRVATFVDYGVSGKMPYLVLEYLIGTDLAAYRDARKLTLQELHPIVLDVASGLSALHGAHLIHRDMKPGNVFLRLDLRDGERFDPRRHRAEKPLDAVVIDFGFVRPMTGHAAEPETFVAGTLGYLSPEQAWGRSDLDSKADVYGLAATVYSALTAKAFFDELRPRERILAHRSAPPLESPERVRELPASLVQLLRRSTALEPAERPTLTEFAEQFSAIG